MNFEWHFNHHFGRRIDKWRHYFDIYDRHFDRFRGTAPRVLEIGVDHGGSLQVWRKYFGQDALIVGVDIDPRCKEYEEAGIQVEIGDQANAGFLATLGEFDIVIDDGSHRLIDQITSFQALWPKTKSVYLIEDCHGGLPALRVPLTYTYPWVIVAEQPKRVIRGIDSRELRSDEEEASNAYRI